MAETLIFSTGSRIISGTLHSTASISQLDLDGVSGSFTGSVIGSFIGDGVGLTGVVSVSHAVDADATVTSLTASYVVGANVDGSVESASFASTASLLLGSIESASFAAVTPYDGVINKPALISSSAQFDVNDDFLIGAMDMAGDLEIREGFGVRIGHFQFIQGPDPTQLPSESFQEFQVLGGNFGPDSMMMVAAFSNTASIAPHVIFGRSNGDGLASFGQPLDGFNLGGLLWAQADGFSTSIRVHLASIRAEKRGFTPTEGFGGADLIFSVAQNVSANDITEAMRIRTDLTLELSGNVVLVNGTGMVIGHTAKVVFGATTPELQVLGTSNPDSRISLARFSGNTNQPRLVFGKSRGALGSPGTTIVTGDNLGSIDFQGDDGSDMATTGASIIVISEGTIGSNRIPTRMEFRTGTDVTTTVVTTALVIDSAQKSTFSGSLEMLDDVGFFNTGSASQPVVTGTRSGSAALASLLAGLETLGLIVDNTS